MYGLSSHGLNGRISPAEIVHLADFLTNRPLKIFEEWDKN